MNPDLPYIFMFLKYKRLFTTLTIIILFSILGIHTLERNLRFYLDQKTLVIRSESQGDICDFLRTNTPTSSESVFAKMFLTLSFPK